MTVATTHSADETRALAAALATVVRPGDLVVLAGSLGAGKTTFAQGLARGLGVTERVTSPTFTIVREYEGAVPLVHVDVYRLDSLQELHDLGFEEVVGDDRVTMVEWGDAVAPLLPSDRLVVRLECPDSSDERRVRVEGHGRSWQERRAALVAALAPFADAGEG